MWVQTVLAFAFLYWELDGGGPVNRHLHPRVHPDMAFPQQLEPELAAPGWRPVFADYLFLAVANAVNLLGCGVPLWRFRPPQGHTGGGAAHR